MTKLISLVRQEEAFNKSRRGEGETSATTSGSKKRPYEAISEDAARDEADVAKYIDKILGDEDILGGGGSTAATEKDAYEKAKRPTNWRAIAQHFDAYGSTSTISNFPEV